jgi:photosystem II stability/assembly factor-like uncharacterized protein
MAAAPRSYFGRYAPPFPLPIIVYRAGQTLRLTPTGPGDDAKYEAVVQAGTAILSELASVEGPVPLPAGVSEASPAYSVQFVYRTESTPPTVVFSTAFGAVTLDRVLLLLDPALDAPTTIWASRAGGGWIALTSPHDRAELRAAVAAAVGERPDWGPPPTPPAPAPPVAPSATPPSAAPTPATPTPAPPALTLPPASSTPARLAPVATATPVLLVTTDPPPTGGTAPWPPAEAPPSPPPPFPSPPAESGPADADTWRMLAAQVPYPLYVPAPDSGLVVTQGPYLSVFPLEAGPAGTYPGVAAGYRIAATGETLTVVQMAGLPGDKRRFGPLLWGNGLLGFYYADAAQRRLIFQRSDPTPETNIMFRTGTGISQDALFALAAGMQRLPYPAATPTPPAPTLGEIIIHDLTFVDATHGWLLGSSCLLNGQCTYTIRATTDGGHTWRGIAPAPLQAPARLRFVTIRDGWIYGTHGWFTTHDGGATWTPDSQQRAVALVEPAGRAVWAIERMPGRPAGESVRLLRWTDAGHTWTPAPSQPALRGDAILAHAGALDAWVLAAWDAVGHAPGQLSATHDGGKTWQARPNPCADQPRLAAVAGELWMVCAGQPDTDQRIQEKTLYRSTDDGRQWVRVASYDLGPPQTLADPPPGRLPMANIWDLTVPAPGQGWMILAPGWLARSTDGGRTWRRGDLPYADLAPGFGLGPLVFVDPQHGWVAGRSGLFRTTDGGAHWETVVLRR